MNTTALRALLDQLSLDEKIGQLLQLSGDFFSQTAGDRTGPMAELGLSQEQINQAGSILGVSGAAEVRRIQTEFMATHRLHIPLLFMGDVVHGAHTIFPIPLGLASSWDESAMAAMAKVSAAEAAATGLQVVFAPMVDLVRDPRWGRVMESTGEDPYLNARFAAMAVRGFQGEQPSALAADQQKVAACVKHFAAYGAVSGGREYNTVDLSERLLRDCYLPSYRAAVKAGAKLVMTSFNTVDGIPSTGNRHLMQEILRDEWGFGGTVITDYAATQELIAHGVAADQAEAARLSLNAGVDIEMMTTCYVRGLKSLLERGEVSPEQIDRAALRVLSLKNDLGLFEDPYRGLDERRQDCELLSPANLDTAQTVAQESIVLLQNDDDCLPLSPTVQALALVGPFARSHDLMGSWSWQGREADVESLAQVLPTAFPGLAVAKTDCDPLAPTEQAVKEAVSLATTADITLLALGEPSAFSGEAASRADIRLPQAQLDLLEQVCQVCSQVVVILFNGRPLDLTAVVGQTSVKAIVEAWYPGTRGARALAGILSGQVNPSGKLTMSFPISVGQVPVFYNHDNTGRPLTSANAADKYVSKYLDVPNEPRYPFGFGLSYGRFEYGPVELSASEFDQSQTVTARLSVSNLSAVDGTEIVQLYARDLVAEVERPVKQLVGFQRIELTAGESQTVEFCLTADDFAYVHRDLGRRTDPGDFDLMAGSSSAQTGQPARLRLV